MRRSVRMAAIVVASFAAVALIAAFLLLHPVPVPEPQLGGELREGSIAVDGRPRSFLFYVPRAARRGGPLVLALHGSRMNGALLRRSSSYELDRLADRHGFIVVYPDAHAGIWNDCRATGDFASRRAGIDDVRFLRMLVAWFAGRYGISDEQVFAFGISNGGHMSYRLAMEAPDLVRAIAVIAANMPAQTNLLCTARRPLPVMLVSGTDDPLAPYEGGQGGFFGRYPHRGEVRSSEASARFWATLAGHRREPQREPIADGDPEDGTRATRMIWRDANAPEVVLISVAGGGHTIPHPRATFPRILGRTSHDFDAAEEIWSFFSRARAAERPRGTAREDSLRADRARSGAAADRPTQRTSP